MAPHKLGQSSPLPNDELAIFDYWSERYLYGSGLPEATEEEDERVVAVAFAQLCVWAFRFHPIYETYYARLRQTRRNRKARSKLPDQLELLAADAHLKVLDIDHPEDRFDAFKLHISNVTTPLLTNICTNAVRAAYQSVSNVADAPNPCKAAIESLRPATLAVLLSVEHCCRGNGPVWRNPMSVPRSVVVDQAKKISGARFRTMTEAWSRVLAVIEDMPDDDRLAASSHLFETGRFAGLANFDGETTPAGSDAAINELLWRLDPTSYRKKVVDLHSYLSDVYLDKD